MQGLIKGISKSFSTLSIQKSSLTTGIRNYSLVIESVEFPKHILESEHKKEGKEPTRARKLRVKRDHQRRQTFITLKQQKPITDWRLAPPAHLPAYDASKVAPKVNYKARVDEFEDTPNGWKQRRHQKLLDKHQQDKKTLKEIKEKRKENYDQFMTKERQRKQAFQDKMAARVNDSTTVDN
ncbi:hypothetical protein CYY_001596 [Polysphondylium violaceum]|uniref:Uncharacterized protein n=1 Tax=Polysphondylium violaceum TaxID=133409 RepID=A0A8J4V7S0_9MYCE|nr:hypothetical protein CYY_001596 [Polysphondylium violaceum]